MFPIKKLRWLIFTGALVLLATPLLAACAKAPAPAPTPAPTPAPPEVRQFKFQTFLPPGSVFTTSYAEYAGDVIKKLTNGEIAIKQFSGNSLVPAKEQFDAVSKGLLDFAYASPGRDAGKIGPVGNIMLGMPFMWKTVDEMNILWHDKGIKDIIEPLYAEHNITVVIPASTGGSTRFMTTVPIKTLADFDGVKLRISGGKPAAALWMKFGVQPVSMGMGDVYTSLATGVIDGASGGSIAQNVSTGWHEYTQYYIAPGYINAYACVIIANTDVWNSLTETQQEIIKLAFINWWRRARQLGEPEDVEALKKLRAEGKMKIVTLPKADVLKLTKAAEEVWDKEVGDDATAIKALNIIKDYLRGKGYLE